VIEGQLFVESGGVTVVAQADNWVMKKWAMARGSRYPAAMAGLAHCIDQLLYGGGDRGS
jgi:hypothetical protein